MTYPYFLGKGEQRKEPLSLPQSRRPDLNKPENFKADTDAVSAVNVALLLGQPLLLTGEPGTGKTQLGYYIAWELGIDRSRVFKFETKSNSTATSLFYAYDALKRFQHVQSNIRSESALPYITYNALGKAILFSNEPDEVARYLPEGLRHPGKSRSLVIIDEIDKAPRDFPNDILNELDQLYFRIPELDNEPIRVDEALRPIVILTSNSEKDLPDAFLRRCIFYNIPFPGRDDMQKIVESRLGVFAGGSSEFLSDALDLFYLLRGTNTNLKKKPATAELLEWMMSLRADANGIANPLRADPAAAMRTLSALVKTVDDQKKARSIVETWTPQRT